MSRPIGLLSARALPTLPKGDHKDGGNLYLRVKDSGSRSWVFRYKKNGKANEIGLGGFPIKTLQQAREIATLMRQDISAGKNPSLRKNPSLSKNAKTFEDWASDYIKIRSPEWRNPKHLQQWENTLRDYAFGTIGKKHLTEITFQDIKTILDSIWLKKTETATRLRGRIECILDYAAVNEQVENWRNPAIWKGNLDKVLSKPNRIAKVTHHASAPYTDIPQIMSALREKKFISAYCLRFTILTGARSGEARGALWHEINFKDKTWTIPAERTKAERIHVVPLCDEAIEILKVMKDIDSEGSKIIFCNRKDKQMSDVSLNKALKSVYPDVTVHGFRSTFRVWGAETTSYPSQVLEFAIAHVDPDKVQEAYQRSRLIERRRELMKDWGNYCL